MKNSFTNALSRGLRILAFVSFFSMTFACSEEVSPDIAKQGTLNTDPGSDKDKPKP